jgi:hypothetical protein
VSTPGTAQDLAAALVSALESNVVSPPDLAFNLLAEDNLDNQKLVVRVLEKWQFTLG